VYNGDKTPVQKLTHVTVKTVEVTKFVWEWGQRPHNFLALGAIAPMESVPMMLNQQLI